ncbi:hypothetical protein CBM2609_A10089 [Cupriavidus taiwanensis]|nr:hypothetical protein CBM2604_A10088 [Cupriavidus taiwanensis]SOZ20311.1 hypothetical protein CBM2609_A10089 [Cupriavidus taiwanensis]SOZ41103.1 hypothetical protein CBM2610_A10113 [Cupriavidus taiwanensis]
MIRGIPCARPVIPHHAQGSLRNPITSNIIAAQFSHSHHAIVMATVVRNALQGKCKQIDANQ